MNPTKQARGDYILDLIDKSPLSRNQIAAISGLSNPYILDLEKGAIANVGREKLIALSIALDLSLQDMDAMMMRFDRAPLSKDDIQRFLDITRRIRISAALHPVHDSFTFDLVLLSVERRIGHHLIVSPRPASCLRAEGHRRYAEKPLCDQHALYGDLVEAIVRERKRQLLGNLAHHPVENYVCRDCLSDYIQRCQDPSERKWRARHIRSAINLIETHDNFKLHLTTECPSFIFVLKTQADAPKLRDTLVIANIPPHRYQVKSSGLLAGFATENQAVIENFNQEIRAIRSTVIDAYEKRENLVAYLEAMIAEVA